jgi:polyisoprenyl-phosphate glycosyltransferase
VTEDSHKDQLISIVLPLYREAANLPSMLAALETELSVANIEWETVLVDDGSPDGTWAAVQNEAGRRSNVRAVRLSRNFGKEHAIVAGLEHSSGAAVIVMDADGQHPASLIPKMVNVWREAGVEIVDGVKTHRGRETFGSRVSAALFYFIWNTLSGFELKGASDFKLLSRRAVAAYLDMGERNVFFRGMTAWLGFSRAQIPFEVAERTSGRSGWPVVKRLKLAIDGISQFSSLPLQLVTFAGVVFLCFSVIFGLYTLIVQLAGRSVTGFATVILLLLFIGSLLMISLGIIGIYLARIYEEIKRRPRYVVAALIESNEQKAG